MEKYSDLGRVMGLDTHRVLAVGPGPGPTRPAKHYPRPYPDFPGTRISASR